MLRAFLEDSWEGPLVWLAEPLPSVLRLWRPSLRWSRLGLAPLVGTLPGSLSKTIRHHSQKGHPSIAHKCGATIRIFAPKGTSVLVYSALGRLSKEVPNIITITGIEQKKHSIDGAHILRIVFFLQIGTLVHRHSQIFINVFFTYKDVRIVRNLCFPSLCCQWGLQMGRCLSTSQTYGQGLWMYFCAWLWRPMALESHLSMLALPSRLTIWQ